MKTFKEKLLALVENTASQARDFIGGFSTMVDEIDWDNHFNAANEFMRERKESLTAKANDLLKEFSDLVKQVKDNLTDFSITVAFDETLGEKLNYEVVKNEDETFSLAVEVSYNDETTTRSNKTAVKIPQNCDLTKINKTVNKVAKTVTISIPKVIIEPIEEKKKEDLGVGTKKKKARKKAYKKVVESVKNEETDTHEETTHVSSKLAERLKQNVERAKLRRDASGRFVRRDAPKS